MSDPVFHVLQFGGTLGFALEFISFFLAPGLLARAAFIPAGPPRRLQLGRKAREVLSSLPTHSGGYREPVARSFDLTRLALPQRVDLPGFIARAYTSRGFVTVRLPYSWAKNRAIAIARIDIRESDGVIEMRGTFIPVTWMTVAGVGVAAAVTSIVVNGATRSVFESFVIGGLFIVLNVVFGYLFSRSSMKAAVEAVSREIERALIAADT